jgi:hypothetical protein
LGRGTQASRAGADNGYLFAGAKLRRFRRDPPFLPAAIDNGALDVLDRYRRGNNPENAGAFARSGADAPGEIGEIVGFVEAIQSLAPKAAIDQVVPFGNQIMYGTSGSHPADQVTGVAKRNAAIHAAGALRAKLFLIQMKMKFVPIANPLRRRTVQRELAQILFKSFGFTH